MPNRLAAEKSPYLQQHASNPVDWYAWGEEAFARARAESKPLLVSIGYSTCHWCHVMERESFEDEGIARLMNESFVCVKVDREERPDVDKIYMTAVQALTGQGGWPLNAFLTPDLKPFFGGTYFPPKARWGQPGFPDVLKRVAELWRSRRREIESDAAKIADLVSRHLAARTPRAAVKPAVFDQAFAAFSGAFDPEHAGFGGAPKFPMPVNLNFLLRHHARSGRREALDMVLATLRAIAAGGVCDQVGGGFHRYGVDEAWRVPHFEKMLYDNAQLAVCFTEAWQVSGEARLERAARRALDYLLRDLRHPEGGFFSAEDADSVPPEGGEKAEGAFYLWTKREIESALGAEAEAFCRRYGVEEEGNAPFDPHGEFSGKCILYEARDGPSLDAGLEKLRRRRENRARPGLDDKVLACWNGLALSAFAKAAQAFGEPRYLAAARDCAVFLEKNLYDAAEGRLWRRWREGERAVAGTADDYAFVAQGLLDLYEATFEPRWLSWSLSLCERLLRDFHADDGGFFLTSAGHDAHLLARTLEDSDNVEPCASSVAALTLLRLSEATGRGELREAAEFALERFGGVLEDRPLALPQMLVAADFALGKPRQIVIAGPGTEALAREARRRFLPHRVLLGVDDATRAEIAALAPFVAKLPSSPPAAYVCEGGACRLPSPTAEALAKALS